GAVARLRGPAIARARCHLATRCAHLAHPGGRAPSSDRARGSMGSLIGLPAKPGYALCAARIWITFPERPCSPDSQRASRDAATSLAHPVPEGGAAGPDRTRPTRARVGSESGGRWPPGGAATARGDTTPPPVLPN